MLPPGLGFNAVSQKALAVGKTAKLPKSYFGWEEMLAANKDGFFPYTPATNLLYGLAEAIDMLHEEGLDRAFARHDRHAQGVRRAVKAWGLQILCKDPKYYSSTLTAVLTPEGHNADALRNVALEHFDVSLGTGLTKVAGKVFRIGHLGDTNDLTIIATLAGVEMALKLAGVPHKGGGVAAAMGYFTETARGGRT
jgi:alanine-glyoxylate transaminase/serine-glyoxylate transaminase/serine-pyruvate transaminase